MCECRKKRAENNRALRLKALEYFAIAFAGQDLKAEHSESDELPFGCQRRLRRRQRNQFQRLPLLSLELLGRIGFAVHLADAEQALSAQAWQTLFLDVAQRVFASARQSRIRLDSLHHLQTLGSPIGVKDCQALYDVGGDKKNAVVNPTASALETIDLAFVEVGKIAPTLSAALAPIVRSAALDFLDLQVQQLSGAKLAECKLVQELGFDAKEPVAQAFASLDNLADLQSVLADVEAVEKVVRRLAVSSVPSFMAFVVMSQQYSKELKKLIAQQMCGVAL